MIETIIRDLDTITLKTVLANDTLSYYVLKQGDDIIIVDATEVEKLCSALMHPWGR